jgi:DMSO/TMAO reductase YedYZ molybdopterin-dependent catalytic subunit
MLARRRFVERAVHGTLFVALGGGLYVFADDLTREAKAETRPDGRPRVPPGQRVIRSLKPMGGEPGDPNPANFKLKIHGAVDRPFELGFAELLGLPQTELVADVHCVTKWTVLDAKWKGVRVSDLAKKAGLKANVRYVVFEAAHGYTANVPLEAAMRPNVLVTHRLDDRPLGRANGYPLRALVPDLYFWKSAKWLTGVRFVTRDEPGSWEKRGYSNSADPWKEERFA